MIGEVKHGYDPRSYEEAILDIDSGKWLEAMNFEIESMHANQVWTLVDPQEGILLIGCRYQSNLEEKHWSTVKTILKHLRRTKDLIMSYEGLELKIQRCSGSDFKSNMDDKKCTSGFIFTCNGGAVNWKSSKQSTTANSTTEAEYIATLKIAKEVV
ncbi:secreted RxLR effector protein 161-like [Pistacia vera]|uniref:secreted RxLR effector protein 161-like n=1 Tax=Pistacia vera TaxID=55513 RepID=UPI001262D80C|nr:secreted RxLR effector protein 161-like [Pistacia vera]